MLQGQEYIILINDAPYNIYTNNWVETNVETRHYTMYYDEDILPITAWEQVQKYKGMWYSVQEVSDDKKSIKIPHMHFIKIVDVYLPNTEQQWKEKK